VGRHVPQPVTGAEEFLAAVLDEVRQSNELLGQVLARMPRHLGAQAETPAPEEAPDAVVEGAAATEPTPDPEPPKQDEDAGDDVVEVREPDPPPKAPPAPRTRRTPRSRK